MPLIPSSAVLTRRALSGSDWLPQLWELTEVYSLLYPSSELTSIKPRKPTSMNLLIQSKNQAITYRNSIVP